MGREKKGFQVLGVNHYSTGRRLVPLVEIVKRTVHMTLELADRVGAGGQLGEARPASVEPGTNRTGDGVADPAESNCVAAERTARIGTEPHTLPACDVDRVRRIAGPRSA